MLTEEDKKKAVEYEEFYSQIHSIRNPSSGGKKWWEAPVFGSLMTAVLTAVITIGGGYFAQRLMKSNEFELDLFKSELTKKREFLDTTYNFIAEMMKANEERLFFAQGRYDEIPAEKQNELVNATNQADAQWRTKRESAEFQVYLYYGKRPDIVNGWRDARTAIQQYCDCAEKAYLEFQEKKAPGNICQAEARQASQQQNVLRDLMTNEYREQVFR